MGKSCDVLHTHEQMCHKIDSKIFLLWLQPQPIYPLTGVWVDVT